MYKKPVWEIFNEQNPINETNEKLNNEKTETYKPPIEEKTNETTKTKETIETNETTEIIETPKEDLGTTSLAD